jgi:hypothetical protein
MLKKAEGEHSQLHLNKWLFFTGKADPQVYKDTNFDLKVLRQDVDKFIDDDEEIIKSKQKIEYLKQICGYCESILKQINNRTFQIKNAIDWKKFTMGSM